MKGERLGVIVLSVSGAFLAAGDVINKLIGSIRFGQFLACNLVGIVLTMQCGGGRVDWFVCRGGQYTTKLSA